jgi:hypothetical protein
VLRGIILARPDGGRTRHPGNRHRHFVYRHLRSHGGKPAVVGRRVADRLGREPRREAGSRRRHIWYLRRLRSGTMSRNTSANWREQ